MSRIDVIIGNARIKSTKSQIRITYNGDTIKLSKKKIKRFFVKAAVFVICLNIAGKVIDKTWEVIDYQLDVLSMRKEQCIETEQLLLSHNLNVEPGEDGNWCNDYSNIDGLSKDDIYGFYHYCGYSETEKVLKELGYTSWTNFLTHGGYYDCYGAPNLGVWENYAESELIEQREALENGKQH